MTLDELGEQWKENSAGSWGSSEQARLRLAQGVKGSETGHPRHNKLWFTIGPQFSADIYGLLAPGDANLAGRLARTYGRINGHAEAVDGAVFVAGMVSLAFRTTDVEDRRAGRRAPDSPVVAIPPGPRPRDRDGRQAGKSPDAIFEAIEDRWHIEYPATNNAVANGGFVAATVWFGEGDFLKTVNLAYRAADFTDADCNAANAAAVVGAMHGMKALPATLVESLRHRLVGSVMGGVQLTPPVDERLPDIARRTTVVGRRLIAANGGAADESGISVPHRTVTTQEAELFRLADLTRHWNPDWTLERAGFGGAGGGMRGIRGITHLDGDVLATYPRDEVRALVLRRRLRLGPRPVLRFDAGVDAGRAWQLDVFVDNVNRLTRTIDGGPPAEDRRWEQVDVDLGEFAGQEVVIRLYQRVLLPDRVAGNAYWRNLRVE